MKVANKKVSFITWLFWKIYHFTEKITYEVIDLDDEYNKLNNKNDRQINNS